MSSYGRYVNPGGQAEEEIAAADTRNPAAVALRADGICRTRSSSQSRIRKSQKLLWICFRFAFHYLNLPLVNSKIFSKLAVVGNYHP